MTRALNERDARRLAAMPRPADRHHDFDSLAAAAAAPPRAAAVQTCRGCGCDDLNACVDPASAEPCAWAGPGLCTACAAIVRRVFTGPELTFLLHAAGGGDLNLTRPDATALTAQGVLALRHTLRTLAPRPEQEAAPCSASAS